MPRSAKPRGLSIGLAFFLSSGAVLFGQAAPAPQIPPHPRALKFQPLEYTPPKASAYRHVLENGTVGYFVEDHDLPLVNVSILIRTGSYLDPAGKEGLASATASQLRSGGTAHLS
ncbi:MAG: putative Peptidase, partial [Acidobacteria bacterium]|nr:putative Peptidase [Acidobacteriota bacterium]